MTKLRKEGFEIIRDVFSTDELSLMRNAADQLAANAGSACVRHISSKSEFFANLAISKKIHQLIPSNLLPVRSILFDKTPAQNWPVAWHQDLTIAVTTEKEIAEYGPWSFKDGSPHVQPPAELLNQMTTVRIHLDDTPSHNGALKVIAETHHLGKIPSTEVKQHSQAEAVTCECLAGDVLLMSPLILHSSSRSEKPKRRRILHFDFAPHSALHPELSWYEQLLTHRR